MNKSFLVKWFGFPATLLHGDTMVLDRWRWLCRHLLPTKDHETFLDAGCGSGAFTIYAGKLGYDALGLSWDERNQDVAIQRAKLCAVDKNTHFHIQDLRTLEKCTEFHNKFNIVISFENIEHIIDDIKLIKNLASCLKPGGRLLLTTPNFYFRPMGASDLVPFKKTVEDGSHVRKGYSPAMLQELCDLSGLKCEEISYCSGFFSQKITALQNWLSRISFSFSWCITLPLRVLPILFDRPLAFLLNWPYYSICMVAYKPRKNADF